jgi:hypothetical protein
MEEIHEDVRDVQDEVAEVKAQVDDPTAKTGSSKHKRARRESR